MTRSIADPSAGPREPGSRRPRQQRLLAVPAALVGLLVLCGPAAGDRLKIEVGPHLSAADHADSAAELANMLQFLLNDLPAEVHASSDLENFVIQHVAQPDPTVGVSLPEMRRQWVQRDDALLLLSGRFIQGERTFATTMYAGTADRAFHVEYVPVQILDTANFEGSKTLANLTTYYALVKDGRNSNVDLRVLMPLIAYAIETADTITTQIPNTPTATRAANIRQDLERLIPAGASP